MLATISPPPVNATIARDFYLNENGKRQVAAVPSFLQFADRPAKSLGLKPVDGGIQCGFA
jgi:hypothetical protein